MDFNNKLSLTLEAIPASYLKRQRYRRNRRRRDPSDPAGLRPKVSDPTDIPRRRRDEVRLGPDDYRDIQNYRNEINDSMGIIRKIAPGTKDELIKAWQILFRGVMSKVMITQEEVNKKQALQQALVNIKDNLEKMRQLISSNEIRESIEEFWAEIKNIVAKIVS